MRGKEEKEAF
jgi:hypothetical protein